MPGQYRVIRGGREIATAEAGKYAGSMGDRIFGHLNCSSGKRKLLPVNRVFFHDWRDAVEAGYRPCRVCRPDKARLDELLGTFHPALDRLHVAIIKTQSRRPGVCFHVALIWDNPDGEGSRIKYQVDLESLTPYPAALARAMKWGKLLSLDVIEHCWIAKNRVRFASEVPATRSQIRKRKEVIASRETRRWAYPSLAPRWNDRFTKPRSVSVD